MKPNLEILIPIIITIGVSVFFGYILYEIFGPIVIPIYIIGMTGWLFLGIRKIFGSVEEFKEAFRVEIRDRRIDEQ